MYRYLKIIFTKVKYKSSLLLEKNNNTFGRRQGLWDFMNLYACECVFVHKMWMRKKMPIINIYI